MRAVRLYTGEVHEFEDGELFGSPAEAVSAFHAVFGEGGGPDLIIRISDQYWWAGDAQLCGPEVLACANPGSFARFGGRDYGKPLPPPHWKA
jgi:hypothetical protein